MPKSCGSMDSSGLAGASRSRHLRTRTPILALVWLMITVCSVSAQDRRIEPGDRIKIIVFGNEELSRSLTVGEQGRVPYPFLSEEQITGYSLFELRLLVRTTLSQYVDGEVPTVDIVWDDDTGTTAQVTVSVLGLVLNPGEYTVPGTAGLQAALAAAGGALPGALVRSVKVHRNMPEGPVELMVDLERFFETGDVRYIPAIHESDVIVVPGGTAATAIRVVGAVENPGNYQAAADSKVFDVILQAGGFTPDARTDKIRLIKTSTGVSEEYALNINAFLQSGVEPDTPPVAPGDIIMVPERFLSWRRVFSGLRDIASVATVVTLFVVLFR